MGGKSGGKIPQAPDPYEISDAQTQSNQDTAAYNAALNRVNTHTPFGSQTFTQTGTDASGAPIYDQNITLSPQQQQLLDMQQGQDLSLGGISGNQIDQMSQAYARGIDPNSLDQYRQQ